MSTGLHRYWRASAARVPRVDTGAASPQLAGSRARSIPAAARPRGPEPAAGAARPDATDAAGTHRRSSVALPLQFVLVGLASLVTGGGLLVARPDLLATYHYNQYVIATTHLLVLGFITSIVFGAMYQLVPVALETRLHSERLARGHFFLHVAGVAGMVVCFWRWNLEQVGHAGSLLALGVGFFIYNLVRTLRSVARRDVVATAIASSLFWLGATVLAGLYLAASKCWTFSPFATIPAMHAHAHLGAIGIFLTLIAGISYKLIPMFALSRIQNPRRAAWSIRLLNAGLAGLFLSILLGWPIKPFFAAVVAGALLLYGIELRAILRARLRRQLDGGLRCFLTAVWLLVPTALIGLVLSWPNLPATAITTQLENVYGFLGLIGVIGFAILGMLSKIVPFLVWVRTYSPEVGRRPVPSLADMSSTRMQAAGYWTFLVAVAATSVSTALGHEGAVRWSCVGLMIALLVFLANQLRVLSHWVYPRLDTRSTVAGPSLTADPQSVLPTQTASL